MKNTTNSQANSLHKIHQDLINIYEHFLSAEHYNTNFKWINESLGENTAYGFLQILDEYYNNKEITGRHLTSPGSDANLVVAQTLTETLDKLRNWCDESEKKHLPRDPVNQAMESKDLLNTIKDTAVALHKAAIHTVNPTKAAKTSVRTMFLNLVKNFAEVATSAIANYRAGDSLKTIANKAINKELVGNKKIKYEQPTLMVDILKLQLNSPHYKQLEKVEEKKVFNKLKAWGNSPLHDRLSSKAPNKGGYSRS